MSNKTQTWAAGLTIAASSIFAPSCLGPRAARVDTVEIPVATASESLAQLDRIVETVEAYRRDGKIKIEEQPFLAQANALRMAIQQGRYNTAEQIIPRLRVLSLQPADPAHQADVAQNIIDPFVALSRDVEVRAIAERVSGLGITPANAQNETSVSLSVTPVAELKRKLEKLIKDTDLYHERGNITVPTDPLITGISEKRYESFQGRLASARFQMNEGNYEEAWALLANARGMRPVAKSIDRTDEVSAAIYAPLDEVLRALEPLRLRQINNKTAGTGGQAR